MQLELAQPSPTGMVLWENAPDKITKPKNQDANACKIDGIFH